MATIRHLQIGQPNGENYYTPLLYHIQQLLHNTPLHTTRPEPKHTHQQLALAELLASARKTIAQLARTQHPYPTHIPNRFYRHFQRYFDPDAAFEHLCQQTLPHCPPHQPYCIAIDVRVFENWGD